MPKDLNPLHEQINELLEVRRSARKPMAAFEGWTVQKQPGRLVFKPESKTETKVSVNTTEDAS